MNKKIFVTTISFILLVCSLFCVSGCKKESNEDIVYKMACYIADYYDIETSDIVIASGNIQYDEGDSSYIAHIVATIYAYNKVFKSEYCFVEYYPETERISYSNKTGSFGLAGPGPLFYKTDSFNIEKVNDMLQSR